MKLVFFSPARAALFPDDAVPGAELEEKVRREVGPGHRGDAGR